MRRICTAVPRIDRPGGIKPCDCRERSISCCRAIRQPHDDAVDISRERYGVERDRKDTCLHGKRDILPRCPGFKTRRRKRCNRRGIHRRIGVCRRNGRCACCAHKLPIGILCRTLQAKSVFRHHRKIIRRAYRQIQSGPCYRRACAVVRPTCDVCGTGSCPNSIQVFGYAGFCV